MNTDQALDAVKWLRKTNQPTQLLNAAIVLADEVSYLRNRLATKESERQFFKSELRRLRKQQAPSNAELRGASQLHGEASLSNDVLGAGTRG